MEAALTILDFFASTSEGRLLAFFLFLVVGGGGWLLKRDQDIEKQTIASRDKQTDSNDSLTSGLIKLIAKFDTSIDTQNAISRDVASTLSRFEGEQSDFKEALKAQLVESQAARISSEAHHIAIRERVDEMTKVPELLEELSAEMVLMRREFSEFKASRELKDDDRDEANRKLSDQMSKMCDLFVQFSIDVKGVDNPDNDPLATPDKDVVE